ncbi:MAG TPA: secretin N-terminal domain-containing protein, partial [Thermoanaerobaculia bacterium]|nr:secretin N-terminal domain-containing protein [Thermoanaerobaculia bacterium]
MKPMRLLALFILLLATACAGSRAFSDAREEESAGHWDLAVLKYARALEQNPASSQYKIALGRAKIKASQFHFEKGKLYRSGGQPELAVVELEQAFVLDSTNKYAETELRKAREDAAKAVAERTGESRMEAAKRRTRGMRARAPMLEPTSDRPINLNFPQPKPIKQIYQSLASAAGINVIFDPQLKDDNVSIVLTNVEFQTALETLMRQENHFYKVVDEHTMLIAADNPQNRKTYEDLVIRTFFLSNGDVTEVSNALRSLLQTTRISINKGENSITLRDTADKVAIAEKIVEQNDKQLSEVVVDVELLQINANKTQDLGLLLSSYAVSASIPAPGGKTDLGVDVPAGSFTWDQLKQISIHSFGITIPSLTYSFLKNNTDAELLAKPQLRISEGQKAQLIIGDKVPIPTTTFNTGTTVGGNIVPVTAFQYLDVGIKIDVEPRVHHNREITMKLTVEVSNLNGSVPIPGGGTQPIIGTRTISSNIRLKDGETNFLAGLLRNDKSRITDTIPFLGDIPILGRIFSKKSTTNNTTDLVLTLTPHIIRIPDITDEDLTPVYVGTDANISFQGTPRIESPVGAGPFDFGRRQPPAPARTTPGPSTTPAPINLAPGGMPSDLFRPTPAPQPTPVPGRPPSAARPGEAAPVDEPAVADQPGASDSSGSVVFDFDPASLSLATGQRRSVLVRAAGNLTLANTTLAISFDPKIVAAVTARPILPGGGLADAHIESGRVVIEIQSPLSLSGTQAVAEIVFQGMAAGNST